MLWRSSTDAGRLWQKGDLDVPFCILSITTHLIFFNVKQLIKLRLAEKRALFMMLILKHILIILRIYSHFFIMSIMGILRAAYADEGSFWLHGRNTFIPPPL